MMKLWRVRTAGSYLCCVVAMREKYALVLGAAVVCATQALAVELSYNNRADWPPTAAAAACITDLCVAGSFYFANQVTSPYKIFTTGEEACELASGVPGAFWQRSEQFGQGCWVPEHYQAGVGQVSGVFRQNWALRGHTCHGISEDTLLGLAQPYIEDQPRCAICGPGRAKPYLTASFCAPILDRNHDKPNNSCGFGNPIYPLTGAKRQAETLGNWFTGTPVVLHYDTRRKLPAGDGVATFALKPAASFGELWESTLHKKLAFQVNNAGIPQVVQASRGSGRWVTFVRNLAAGTYAPDSDVVDQLVAISGGWLYVDAKTQAQETYNTQGMLTGIQSARGGSLAFAYSDTSTPANVAPAADLLTKVTDWSGRAMRFEYEQPAGMTTARVVRVIDPDDQIIQVAYDAAANLSRIVWPDGHVRQFLYEQDALPWALTGILDENDERHSTYSYDEDGRALSTEYAGGANRYGVSYASAPRWVVTETAYDSAAGVFWRDHTWQLPAGTVVTTPNGSPVNLEASLINGMPLVTTQSQPAGSGCASSSRTLVYDANGNIASKVDFNGNRSCHAYDLTRNLEIARLEGLSSTDACPSSVANYAIPTNAALRKSSIQWHLDWGLEAKRAEPKKITTFIYNGQADPTSGNTAASCAPGAVLLPDGKRIAVLCKKVEQATTDGTGSLGFSATTTGTPRTWTYTYNQYGQTLTARDPLNKLTTYVYYSDTTAEHTTSDLQSVTDAAGRVTQYTRYDKSGRLMQSIDANGAMTDTTYTPRGWVKTVTVTPSGAAAQLTVYDYDGVGQLKKVTLPDGSALEYTYDAAHRLTSVKDTAGNSVTYALDNMGNRTGEDLKDPSGTLARNITRVYDALNRAQSTTGTTQ